MKKLLFLLTAALAVMSMQAAPVDQATAQKVAKSYLTNELYAGKIMAPAALNPVLLKAEMGSNKLAQPVYYIFNTSTTFLVIAGDDRAEEILMVGDKPLKMDRIPDGLQYLLDCYKEQIEFLQERPGLIVDKVDPNLKRNMLTANTYGPLLTANWDQEAPYNNLCKFTYNGSTYTCLTGCPATSASMVLYYWKYPTTQIPAIPSYSSTLEISSTRSVSFTYPALEATTFDWANMKDSYSSYNTAQANAVATLMRYVGQAEQMVYGTYSAGGSGIYTTNANIIAEMFKNWGYQSTAARVYKSSYTSTNWANLIINEMAEGRPIVYMGVSTSGGGHAFNVDGYRDSDSKYHVNFGWSGDGNNWYAMNAFSYSGYTFSSDQQAIIGIQPPSGVVVPTPELSVSPTSLSFSANTNGTVTKTFTVTGTDLQGNVNVSVSGSSYFTVSPTTISATQAAAGATVTVTYAPTTAGSQTSTVTVSSTGAASKTVSLTGTSASVPSITATPNSLSFNTEVGTPVTQTFVLKGENLKTSSPVTLSVSGSGFSIDKTSITKTAVMNGSTVTVTYNPTSVGNHTGTITISHADIDPITVSLTGTATGVVRTITANPTSLTFDALLGETKTKTFTVNGQNLTGNLTLALNNANGNYSITPTTLTAAQAHAGATVTVTYAPTSFGASNASVTISGGGADAVTVNLAGQANLVKYAPVMLPANEEYINLTQFRADWTDETPANSVTSYTLEVTPKPTVPEVELIGSLAGTSFTGSATGYYDITLPAPWAGVNVRGGLNSIIYFRNNYQGSGTAGNITYTIPEGYNNATFTLRITSGSGSDGAGNLTVATPQTAAVNHTFTVGSTYYWLVTASSGEKITITTPDANYSPDISLIEVYTGDARPATLMATETGDENSRLITGITDKFYTIENLVAEGTFLYRVKTLYIDGTESDWSNVEEVTLFENGHGFELGDVNHDGSVNIKDVTDLIDALLSGGEICEICADVKADGLVNITDATELIDKVLGGESASLNAPRPQK